MHISKILLFIAAMLSSSFLWAGSIDTVSDSFISVDQTIDRGKGGDDCDDNDRRKKCR